MQARLLLDPVDEDSAVHSEDDSRPYNKIQQNKTYWIYDDIRILISLWKTILKHIDTCMCIYIHTHKDSLYFATETYASSWVGITMVTIREARRVLRLRRCVRPLLVVTALAASQSFVAPITQAEAEETDANLII